MEDKTYFSYLLRMWQTRRGNELVWMASLDDPHTGKRHSFTTLERLFAFLLKQTQASEYSAEKECDQGRTPDEGSKNDKTSQSK
jgi:hypothetical protein